MKRFLVSAIACVLVAVTPITPSAAANETQSGDAARVPTEPGSITLSFNSLDREYRFDIAAYVTESSAKAVLSGWAFGRLDIDYTWYINGNYTGDSDTDVCYSTSSCTRYSSSEQQIHAKSDDRVCIRVAVRQTSKMYYSADSEQICWDGSVGPA
jgi:hypothetical protein